MGLAQRYILILAVVSALGGLAACGGSSATGNQIDPAGTELTALERLYASDTRLEDAAGKDVSELYGRITLDGLTLADDVAGVSQVSQIPEEKILVRLIDPGDDILIEEINPDLSGHFEFSTIEKLKTIYVEIGFDVAEDLDGDPETQDGILQTVPVTLKTGKAVEMDLVVSCSTEDSAQNSLEQPGVMDVLRPEEGCLVIVQLTIEDAYGFHEDIYGVNYFDATVVYDSDGDESLEFGDDYITGDADSDGMVEDFYDTVAEARVAGAKEELVHGVITKVNNSANNLTIKLADGNLIQIMVDPLVAIEQISFAKDLKTSEFYGPLTLDAGLVGQHCEVVVIPVDDEYYGMWVIVSDEPFPGYE